MTESVLPDLLAPDLRVLFCGINPGRVSAAAGAHFANPRNDFWRLLHAAGFTPRLLSPGEQERVVVHGIGITNAAHRTTPGSGDLRRSDFEGAAERLGRIAAELRPRWIGFVGKEAYRGAFGVRTQLGIQARRLGSSSLFVLPSTSPANAAVPWGERLRWFQELAGRSTGLPLRDAVRALVLDPAGHTLLVRFDFAVEYPDARTVWASPGGGVEPGESDEDALARELAEECGLRDFLVGPLLWTREHWFAGMARWGGQRERHYLVRTERFEPAPEWTADALAAEGIGAQRWWAPDELAAAEAVFAPRRLPELVRALLDARLPAGPLDVGV